MTSRVPVNKPKRIVFLGTPHAAVAPLQRLHQAGFDIVLVVSMADKRRGRGRTVSPSPVKAAAIELGLEVTDDVNAVKSVDADLGVVVAYGRIIKPDILNHLPMVNIHFSLLPRWRGAAPVERAVLAGDTETGVCLMEVAEGLDEGAVYSRKAIPIEPTQSVAELRSALSELGAELLVEQLSNGLPEPEPQVGEATYAAKIDPSEYELDLTRPAQELMGVVRLGQAWTRFRGKRVKITAAEVHPGNSGAAGKISGADLSTGSGILRLVEVKPEGKRAMDAKSWINGAQPQPEEHFG